MTPAVRATVLVIATLAGATAAAVLSIATWSPAKGGEAQDFWREIQRPAPRTTRRIYVTYRLRRIVVRHVADRGWPDARETNRSQIGSRASVPDQRSVLGGARPFAGAIVVRNAQVSPSDDSADSFARRAVLPEPSRNIYVPPDLMQRDDRPLPIFTPPKERREPSDNRRRELCIAAVIVVAVLGGVASVALHQNRGIVHA